MSNELGSGWAIAAMDATAYLKTEGPQRFNLAQDFIQACLADIIKAGTLDHPFAGPHFFCSFTFFDHHSHQAPVFPAATVFLPRWQVACQHDQTVIVANLVVSPDSNLQLLTTNLWQEWQRLQAIPAAPDRSPEGRWAKIAVPSFAQQDVVPAHQFKTAVGSALSAIAANYFHKIVLSHPLDVIAPTPIDWGHALENLRQLNSDCYIFSTSNGQGQTFIGASPERLLSLQQANLITDALAGSAPRGKSPLEDAQYAHHLLRSTKELHEHQVVIDFIRQRLSRLGLIPHCSTLQPCLLQLPNIQHLRTPIQAQVPPDVHLLEILAELHPTPAVAGAPRDIACQEIRRHETFERGLYAAPLGWVDHHGNGEFIVGIRSALLDGCQARLYAGAGIVAGSDPDQELAEIHLKLQALLKALS
ncbi:isochorismate synthase [Neosynechococcus sphagnicola]|uniref:isochorismate synthase n=1 Tax=Neosynechococcus sphagnicola TaxID=1501145 RepID=UPI000AD95429|nr:isochorismate synthase [Neosynechococcus sphagnicola]